LATTASLCAVSKAILWRGQLLRATVGARTGQVRGADYIDLHAISLSQIIEINIYYEINELGTHMRSLSSRPALNNASASSASAGQQGKEKNGAKVKKSTARIKCMGIERMYSATVSNNHRSAAPIMVVCFQGDKSHRPRPVPRSKLTGRSREFMYFSKTFFYFSCETSVPRSARF